MPKLKILYITPTSKISGAETGLCYILDNLDSNVEFIVVCPKGELADRLRERYTQTVNLLLYNLMFKKPHLYLLSIYKLYKLIKKERPSIVHSNGVAVNQFVSIAAKLAGVPCIVHCHTIELFNKANALHLNLCNKIIANSEFTKNRLKEFLPKRDIQVIYGGVDTKKFYPKNSQLSRKKWDIPQKDKVIGMIGMFLPRKGQEYLVEAAKIIKKSIPNSIFVFVGSSVFTNKEYENRIRQMCKTNELNYLFTGFMDDVSEIIPIFDVFCMPSIDEAFGNVLNEVGAMQIPIVAFNSGGIPEIIKNDCNGILVEPKNITEFANNLIKVLKDKNLAKRLAKTARKIVLKKFDARRYAKDLIQVYKELILEVS